MIKLLILGGTGMLGNEVLKYFSNDKDYEVVSTYRNDNVKPSGKTIRFNVLEDNLEDLPSDFDYAINCIGVIKPFMKDKLNAIKINSVFPYSLAKWCNKNNIKLIHITTDCVYSGNKGNYIETDLHDCLDDYGKTKSLGECIEDAMVIRTSIIGEEIHKYASLISWAKSQKGKEIDGYSTHFWNGITTKQFAISCNKIIKENLYEKGLFHVFANDDVTKFQMMEYFNYKYNLGLIINKKVLNKVDRTLRTEKGLCSKLNIPTVYQMIKEM